MRRLGLVLVVLMLAGCDALRDAFQAHPDAAARAGGQTLSVDRLAELAGKVPGMSLQQEPLTRMANVWVDYTLFAQALAEGRALNDSATVLRAAWPLVAQRRWERFHDRLTAGRAQLTPAAVDSAFLAGEARMFQHILVQVPQGATPAAEQQKRTQIESVLRQARAGTGGRGGGGGGGGAQFAQLAAKYSEDPGSKTQGGYLGLSERGQFVPAFEEAAWQLAPGTVSGVVKSPFGFHIIRRPPLAEVRDSFRAELETRLVARFDSAYLDGLAKRRQLEMKRDAPAVVRQATADLDAAAKNGRALVTYRGGRLRLRDLVQWLYALPPENVQALPNATDDQIRQFLRVVAERNLLLAQADSAGVQLLPEDWQRIRAEHDTALALLRSAVGIAPTLFRDSAATPAERTRLAMAHVDGYLDRVVQQRAQFLPVPPFLADVLRSHASWSVSQAGVTRAVERAQAMRARTDTSRGTGMRPAPGPAPAPPAATPPAKKKNRSP